MIRVSVMANDSLVVDSIASILAGELSLDVLQLTYCLPRSVQASIHDHRSMVIMIDDWQAEAESLEVPDSFWHNGPLLLIKASLKTMNIDIYESYQLTSPRMEQLSKLVRDFSRNYLGKINQEVVTWAI